MVGSSSGSSMPSFLAGCSSAAAASGNLSPAHAGMELRGGGCQESWLPRSRRHCVCMWDLSSCMTTCLFRQNFAWKTTWRKLPEAHGSLFTLHSCKFAFPVQTSFQFSTKPLSNTTVKGFIQSTAFQFPLVRILPARAARCCLLSREKILKSGIPWQTHSLAVASPTALRRG